MVIPGTGNKHGIRPPKVPDNEWIRQKDVKHTTLTKTSKINFNTNTVWLNSKNVVVGDEVVKPGLTSTQLSPLMEFQLQTVFRYASGFPNLSFVKSQKKRWTGQSISFKKPCSSNICTGWSVFAAHSVGSQGSKSSSGGQRRLWSASCSYHHKNMRI